MELSNKHKKNNNLLKTKTFNQNDNQISILISSQHKINVRRVTVTYHSSLNIRVDDNAGFRCLVGLT